MSGEKYDEEKRLDYVTEVGMPEEDVGGAIVASRPKFLSQLNHFLSRLGGEERGIERVLPHEKSDQVSRSQLLQLIHSIRTITFPSG
jgi:hypothetical protein